MQKEKELNKSGFTLIELLIVVLIIGVLTAVALPGYRKAVEKSRVTDALTTMQAVAKSEHSWYLTNNNYTKDFANLDIVLIDVDGERAEGASYDTANYTFTLQDNNIVADRKNGEYSLYKLYEDGNIYCLPQDHYICQQFGWGANKTLCNNIHGAWSNVNNQCYNSPQERCAASETGATWQGSTNGYCGWNGVHNVEAGEFEKCANGCQYSTFTGEGSTCVPGSFSYGCGYSNFYQGAECPGYCIFSNFYSGSKCTGGCNYSTFTASTCSTENGGGCFQSIFLENSICDGGSGKSMACQQTKFYSGSKCIAGINGSCAGAQYYGTSCCEGQYCSWNSPKCNCPKKADGTYPTSC